MSDQPQGAVMAVPAHDKRDHEFAKQFGLAIRTVIVNDDQTPKVPWVLFGAGCCELIVSLRMEMMSHTVEKGS